MGSQYGVTTNASGRVTSMSGMHPLGEVVSALAASGLTVEFLHEFDYTLYERFRFMRREGRAWTLPEHRESVPLLYSLRARKPA